MSSKVYRIASPLIGIIVVIALASACSLLRRRHSFTWQLTLQVVSPAADREAIVNRTISVIERRLDAAGVPAFGVRAQNPGSDLLIVTLPNVPDRERLKNLITSGGKLELFHVVSLPSPSPVRIYDTKDEAVAFIKSLGDAHTNRSVLPYTERVSSNPKWVIVEHPPVVDGSELRNAEAVANGSSPDDYRISFSLNREGADKFGAWTGANINEYLGVALNDEVKSIAYIKSQIFDSAEITGRFTKASAEDLALVLRSGALPAPIKIVKEETLR
jgi:preprotein translocase subunit SecD